MSVTVPGAQKVVGPDAAIETAGGVQAAAATAFENSDVFAVMPLHDGPLYGVAVATIGVPGTVEPAGTVKTAFESRFPLEQTEATSWLPSADPRLSAWYNSMRRAVVPPTDVASEESVTCRFPPLSSALAIDGVGGAPAPAPSSIARSPFAEKLLPRISTPEIPLSMTTPSPPLLAMMFASAGVNPPTVAVAPVWKESP